MNAPREPAGAAGRVFREPWEAQVFAMALVLHEAGLFSWSEWTAALSREIAASPPGEDEAGDYGRWLAALESLAIEKDVASAEALTERKAAWARAAEATPHGSPILLSNDPEARVVSAEPGNDGDKRP